MGRWKRWAFVGIAVCAGIVLAWYQIRNVKLDQILNTLSLLQPWQIAVILALPLLGQLVNARRWQIILENLKAEGLSGWHQALKLCEYLVAAFAASWAIFSFDLPGKGVRFELLRRRQVSSAANLYAIALDALITTVTHLVLLFAIFFAIGLGWTLKNPVVKFAFLISSVSLVPFLIAFTRPEKILRILPERWRTHRRVREFFDDLASRREEIRGFLHSPKLLAKTASLSCITFAILVTEFFVLGSFLGAPMTLPSSLLLLVGYMAAWVIPITGGIGATEVAAVHIFWLFGYSPAAALTFAFVWRLKDIFWFLVGAIFLWKNGVKLSKHL